MATGATAAALQQAAEGLTYQSESDAPWRAFAWPDAEGKPTAAEVRARGGHKGNAPAREEPVEGFFAPLVAMQDWYGDAEKAQAEGYKRLLDAVRQRLSGATVVRVGRRRQAVYVVGQAPEGGWAGLRTAAVET